jgi:hypothetical protein
MATDAVDERPPRPLLTLGPVDLVRIQVGYRAQPDGPAHQQFLIDLPVPPGEGDQDAFDESWVLSALEPVLREGGGPPRHYSLHVHRWHTSWGPSPGALEIGLLVTAGTRSAALSDAWQDVVTSTFRDLLGLAGRPATTPTSRDAAILRARRSVATAHAVDPDALSLSSEEHHPSENAWTVGLRTRAGDEYDVVVGLVDGYARSVRVRHVERIEVSDSVGSE